MDVREWLRSLGLGQYEEEFRDNKIDFDVLADLTDGDLEKLGVPLGDRRRLLRAIPYIARDEPLPAPSRPSPAALAKAPGSFAQSDLGERRPITVMFCDLVGSTELAAALDPEDWRNLVNSFLDEASKAVVDLGGHVLKRLGDGLMALFGYPQAQENDAERAVRAGLAVQRAIAEINARNAQIGAPGLTARIGLESGPVIVDSTGEVFGETPNVAARVQAAAEPGTVMVTSTVQRQVAGLFIVEDKGAHELKGVTVPMTLYRVLRISGGRRRTGARLLTPFVGREEDLVVLARRWERVRAGEGQFALITGEPGIGKSRLVEEFRARLGETPHTWAEFSSSQLLPNTPLHPIAEWGRVRFGGPEVAPERRLAELESVLAQVKLDPAEYAPLLAPLVDIPVPPERLPTFPADELNRRRLAGMVAWIMAGARVQPLVLIFDDLQWADPTSIDLVQALSEAGAQARLLILATARPEFRWPWSARSHHTIISLTPLDATQVARMVAEVASQHALSTDVIKGLSERAGGVPLFVEEVTRLLLERGEQGGVQAIPPTLRQSLAARLDRLGTAREVAQIGAVLGRSFSFTLLNNVASQTAVGVQGAPGLRGAGNEELYNTSLRSALDRLRDAGLLFVEGVPPEAVYRFKHALIQDAAYDSLLKSRRQALHRRAAEALIDAKGEPEAIAHHFSKAGLDYLAIEWWGKAGDEALRRSAFKEAIAHLGKAIAMSDKAGREGSKERAIDPAFSGRLLKLHTDYGQAVMWAKGFAAAETTAAYERVSELASQTGDSVERNVAHQAQWIASFIRGDLNLAREHVDMFLREAEASRRMMDTVVAHRSVGLTCIFQGELELARFHLERALTDHVPERDMDARRLFGADAGVTAKAFLALLAWLMGEADYARRLIDQAIREGNETEHVATIATNHLFLSRLEVTRDDPAAALPAAQAFLTFAQAHDMALYAIYGEIFSGWAHGRLTDPETGLNQLRQAMANYLALGNKNATPSFHGLIADLEAKTGRIDDALGSIDMALEIGREIGEHWTDSLLYRLRGEILFDRNPAPVEEAFRTALAVAQRQGARSFELQAALALAKLRRSNGHADEVCDMLARALKGFSPTPGMPEIAEAQTLLLAVGPARM
jgi:class 3 adenylate cyclase/predicted ATPase